MIALVLGILVGASLGIIINNEFNRLSLDSALKIFKKQLNLAYDEGVKYGIVKPKIERINEISKEQMNYMGALDQPNASAAHARHKNKLVSSIKSLEEEKMSLFKNILDSGSDPLLSVIINGETKSVRVSELVPYLETGVLPQETSETKTSETKTDPNSPSSATPRLRVVKSTQENTDGGSKPNPSDPAVH